MDFDPLISANLAVRNARRNIKPAFEDGPVGDLERDALAEGLPLWLSRNSGWLYLAANASWPGLYKIGCTRRTVESRMRELNNAGMPTPWVHVATWEVHDAHGLEALAHAACKRFQLSGELFDSGYENLSEHIERVIADDLAVLVSTLDECGLSGLPNKPVRGPTWHGTSH